MTGDGEDTDRVSRVGKLRYRTAGTEYVVIASGGGDTAELVAFSIGGR